MTDAEQAAADKVAADEAAAAKDKDGEGNEPTLTDELVKSIADTQARTADALEKIASPVAAPVTGLTSEQQFAKDRVDYDVRVTAAEKLFEEKAAAGNYAEGIKQLREVYTTAPQMPAQDPTQSAGYISMSEAALARAKDSDEVLEKWGDEVRAEIATLPAEERIKDSGVKEAISRVKARHVNEILEASREKIKADLLKNPAMFQNEPEGGAEGTGGEHHGLDAGQRMAAQAFSITNEAYADAGKHVTLNDDGFREGAIFDENERPELIEAGKF